jgi:hypothetical protein
MKAPKGKSESPRSLHIGAFWKTHFINPPEVQGQVVRLSTHLWAGKPLMLRYQNPIFRSIEKLQIPCHFMHLPKIPEMESVSQPL